MKKIRIALITTATLSVFAGFGIVVFLLNPSSKSSAEPSGIQYDKNCMRKDGENTVLLDEAYGGKRYQYVFSKVKDPSGWVRLLYSIIEVDNAGCKVFTGERFASELPTEELQDKIILAYWRSQAISSQKKVHLEEFLANTPIGITSASSLDLFQKDLEALDQLGVEYPSYVKAIDSFDSPEEAEEYYQTIFDDEWFEAHPEAGAD